MPRRLNGPLVLATHNAGKLREISALMTPWNITVQSAGDLGLPEPDETAPDFAGNAQIKALAAARATGRPALSDDSGFCVAALGGAPGVLSARWAGPDKNFGAAIDRVLAEMTGDDNRAWFVCALCLAWPDGHTDTFIGRVDGAVVTPRGTRGFGYDPAFLPRGGVLTYGEMDPVTKHATSHRARAMAQLEAGCLRSA